MGWVVPLDLWGVVLSGTGHLPSATRSRRVLLLPRPRSLTVPAMLRTRVAPLSTMCARDLSVALEAPPTRQVGAQPLRAGSMHVTDRRGHSALAWARHGRFQYSCSERGELLACTDKVMQLVAAMGNPLWLGPGSEGLALRAANEACCSLVKTIACS